MQESIVAKDSPILTSVKGYFSRITQSVLDDDRELYARLSSIHLLGWKQFAEYLITEKTISKRQANIFRIKLLAILFEEYWIQEICGFHSPLGVEVETEDLKMSHQVLAFTEEQIIEAKKIAAERLKKA